jgi:hypothetical protein
MPSTINSTTSGVAITSDATGALNIQVGGVNAIEIGASASVVIGNLALPTSLTLTTLNATSASITTVTGTTAGFTSANITTLTGTSATITNVLDGVGNVRNIPRVGSAKTSVYTLSISDIGQYVELGTGGGIDVPNGIFSTGNAVSVFNNTTGNRTISLTITTAYLAGTDADKASVTLATRGVATVLFISNSVCVVSGNVT